MRTIGDPDSRGIFERPPTAQEAVLRELRREIMTCRLKPGERIRQEVVAERLGVSRVPVREALKVLAAEGQVVYEAHRGYTVTELSLDELKELYLMRRLLETEALRRAMPGVDAAMMGRLWALLEETERICAAGDFLGVMEHDREFHLALFEGAGLSRLSQTIRLLWQNSEPYRSVFLNDPSSRRRARREHRKILAACEAGDAEAAISALDEHRANAIADLAAVLGDNGAGNSSDPSQAGSGKPGGVARRRGLSFRLLFVGDVVGEAGVEAVVGIVPGLREGLGLDAVVVNGENSAPGGLGITEDGCDALLSVADFVTLGNHAFDADGKFLEREPRAVRPVNLKPGLPGRGWGLFEAGGVRVGVVNVMGRVFLDAGLPSPFEAADRAVGELEDEGADLILVDVHAEATSEKQAMGYHLDGRAQVVVGTHTHIPTADDRVLPGGTAYATDVGMTGREGSVIGFDREDFMALFLGRPRRIGISTEGPVIFRAVVIDLDVENRRATGIERLTREWPAR